MERRRLTWKWRVLEAIVVGLCALFRWRVDVQGLEHVPAHGGAVLAFNHHSYADFVFVAWGPVRRLQRPVRFLAKREIWASRWTGWAVRWVGAVPVDRGSATARAGAFDAAAAALQRGDLVAVAPEQTISPSFELLPLRTGAVRMAQQSGMPIVPVAGWGTQRFATKGQRPHLVTRLPVTVRFGAPMTIGPDDHPIAATGLLQARLGQLLREVQETYPDGSPAGASWVPARLGGSAPRHEDVLREHRNRAERWDPPSVGD